jgi:hypothetical protein
VNPKLRKLDWSAFWISEVVLLSVPILFAVFVLRGEVIPQRRALDSRSLTSGQTPLVKRVQGLLLFLGSFLIYYAVWRAIKEGWK